jgi:hypothetical protein
MTAPSSAREAFEAAGVDPPGHEPACCPDQEAQPAIQRALANGGTAQTIPEPLDVDIALGIGHVAPQDGLGRAQSMTARDED